MEMPILYEDADIVAVDKPSGVMTHPDGRSEEGVVETASDWFAAHYPDSVDVGETQRLQNGTELRRPGIVHRLDRETSGILVFAKTAQAHLFLKEAFQNSEKDVSSVCVWSTQRNERDYRVCDWAFPKGLSAPLRAAKSQRPHARGAHALPSGQHHRYALTFKGNAGNRSHAPDPCAPKSNPSSCCM
jgi:23S rRNA-/tRNA-specific pseudouridylate synthase